MLTAPRHLLVLDFDGVLHEHGVSSGRAGKVDVSPVHRAHASGYAVAVQTANVPSRVAAALKAAGLDAVTGEHYTRWGSARQVLVTQRKLSGAVAIVDDRAVHWTYGSSQDELFRQVDVLRDRYVASHSWWRAPLARLFGRREVSAL